MNKPTAKSNTDSDIMKRIFQKSCDISASSRDLCSSVRIILRSTVTESDAVKFYNLFARMKKG